jgi:hypothetical protein
MSCNKFGNNKGNLSNIVAPIGGVGGGLRYVVEGELPIVSEGPIPIDGGEKFIVKYQPYTPLTLSLAITPSTLQLRGNTIQDVSLTWSYNKAVTSQSIQRLSDGIESLSIEIRNRLYEDVNITHTNSVNERSFRVTGNDGSGQAGGTQQQTRVINFANFIYKGASVIDVRGGAAPLSVIGDLAAVLRNTVVDSFTTSPQTFYYYAFPKRLDPTYNFDVNNLATSTTHGFFQEGDNIRSGFTRVAEIRIPNGTGADDENGGALGEMYDIYQSVSGQGTTPINYTVKG